ncbi:MAG: hypothetical protein DDT27_01291 [Dehalococcoidia bacterium]|nr:hypothetical protein [Chloroflexota bacterium]MBT9162729.1 hypothetical protein [Chloroflexota bacterium]
MVFLGYHFLSFPITGGVGISAHTFGIFHPPSVCHVPDWDLGCTARRAILFKFCYSIPDSGDKVKNFHGNMPPARETQFTRTELFNPK